MMKRYKPPTEVEKEAAKYATDKGYVEVKWGIAYNAYKAGAKKAAKENKALIRDMVATIEDFMPSISKVALQDYGRLNRVLLKSKEVLR